MDQESHHGHLGMFQLLDHLARTVRRLEEERDLYSKQMKQLRGWYPFSISRPLVIGPNESAVQLVFSDHHCKLKN